MNTYANETPTFPDFFAAAPAIRVCDPLADFLGGAANGVIEYRFADAVRLAGHACPTVAGAFLATRAALRALYGEALPRRGEIAVRLRERRDEGVTGVIAAVATLITGANDEGGFRGIGGRFVRRDRLSFGQALARGEIAFVRLDSGACVEVSIGVGRVAGDPRIAELMPRCLTGAADADAQTLFRALWQDRVRRILLEHADDPAVIAVWQEERGR